MAAPYNQSMTAPEFVYVVVSSEGVKMLNGRKERIKKTLKKTPNKPNRMEKKMQDRASRVPEGRCGMPYSTG